MTMMTNMQILDTIFGYVFGTGLMLWMINVLTGER